MNAKEIAERIISNIKKRKGTEHELKLSISDCLGLKHIVEIEEWVNSKEELPEEERDLNGLEMPEGFRYACGFLDGTFRSDETGKVINVTHWQYASDYPT